MKRIKIIAVCLSLLVTKISFAQIEECGRLLEAAVYDEYTYESESSYRYALRQLFSMTKEELQTARDNDTWDVGISAGMGNYFVELVYGRHSESDRLQAIHEKYLEHTELEIERKDYVFFTQRIVNKDVIAAWLECIRLTTNSLPTPGFSYSVEGDTRGTFRLLFKWVQQNANEVAPIIDNIFLQKVQRIEGEVLIENLEYINLQELNQPFCREDSSEAFIVVNHKNASQWSITLPRIARAQPFIEENILIEDDFNDDKIVETIWPDVADKDGRVVTAQNGELRLSIEEINKFPSIESQWITVENSDEPVVVRKQTRVNNPKYNGKPEAHFNHRFYFLPEDGEKAFGISYADYSYHPELPHQGLAIFKNNVNSHTNDPDLQKNISKRIAGIWDEYFLEEIVYYPKIGIVDYFVNGENVLTFNVGQVSDKEQFSLRFGIFVWGWDYHDYVMDDFEVYQFRSVKPTPEKNYETCDDVISSINLEPSSIPAGFALAQNYPNPFNPSTTIEFSLGRRSQVSLRVFDVIGREVATLIKGERGAGLHKVAFEATGLPGGPYFYRIEAGGFVQTKKLMLVK